MSSKTDFGHGSRFAMMMEAKKERKTDGLTLKVTFKKKKKKKKKKTEERSPRRRRFVVVVF